MKVSLRNIYDSQTAIRKLVSADLPIKTAFRVTRMVRKINDIFQDVEKQRVALVEKYGEQAKDGNYKVKNENITMFQKDFSELLNEEVEVDIDQLLLEELSNIKISAVELQALEPFIKE